MLKPRYLIGFAGHRSEFDEAVVRQAVMKALLDLKKRAEAAGGSVELYSSVAEGADTVFVEVGRELGLAVHLLLPLAEHEFERDFSSPESWERTRSQIERARAVPGKDSVRTVSGEPVRPECYFNQAIHMLNAVDVVVAVWNGEPSRGLGGTQQVVDQARAMKIPVIQITADTGTTEIKGDLEGVFATDATITELNEIAERAGVNYAAAEDSPDEFQRCLDQIAVHEARRFRPSLVRIIFIHGFAALLAALVTFKMTPGSTWENTKWLVTLAEFLLVCFALWMSFRLHRRNIQERWIRCRVACELVRGLRASVPILDPLHPAMAQHDPAWSRFCLTVGLMVQEHSASRDPKVLRDEYLAVRLSESHLDGQIQHYKNMHPAALKWWDRTGWMNDWCARLAPPFVLLALVNKISKHWFPPDGYLLEAVFWSWLLVGLFPIALPLLAGIASGLRHVLDAGRRKDRYPQMVARLQELRVSLAGLQTSSTIQEAVDQSEELLLGELLEWQLAMKNTGH